MPLSGTPFVLLVLVYCCVTARARLQSSPNPDVRFRDLHFTDYFEEVKRKRSTFAAMSAVGKKAVQILLKGAKFVYSNGLDSVFLKPGGYAKAIEDFNSLNIRQTKFRLPEGTENVKKMAQIGDRFILLQENPVTGTTITISRKQVGDPYEAAKNRISKIIVYKD